MLENERAQLAAACHRVAAKGLVTGTAGNLSIRVGDHVVITPTGGVLEDLTPEMMTVIDFDGQIVDGDLAPTSETELHLLVYTSSFAKAVAHAHGLASTAVACTHEELPVIHYSQLMLGGSVRTAPYATFGSPELAKNVVAALEGKTAALMANHGSVAHGHTIAAACETLEMLEWSCELYARALNLGTPKLLTDEDLQKVIEAAMNRGYGTTKKTKSE
ncbi:MAG TPA: class II aldolase/adducin family protein [Mycobacteriales bacterium]|nr:class II aldolase/adducin family protein [Mycobacteriales bacterium]